MFGEIFLFEIRSALRKPAPYIYFSVFFLLTFSIGLSLAGVFNTSSSDSLLVNNSAYSVTSVLLGSGILFSLLVSIMLINIVATAIQKDYQYNSHMFFFTKPISKAEYFFGRFSAVFLVATIIISGLVSGFYCGTLFGHNTTLMGPFKAINFIQPFLVFTLPNLFVFSVIFFSLTTYTRTTMASYIVALVLMVVQFSMDSFSSDIDHKVLAAILDPSGSLAFNYQTEYWTPFEKNEKLIPIEGELLYNRLLWLGIGVAICLFSFVKFHFSQFLEPFILFKRKESRLTNQAPPALFSLSDIPVVEQDYSPKSKRTQLWWISLMEFRKMVSGKFFIILCLLMVGMVVLILNLRDFAYAQSTYLVTYEMVEILQGGIGLFIIIFIIFYAGTTLWYERDMKMDEMIGTAPVENTTLFFSKFFGLTMAIGLVYIMASIAGILIQLFNGVTNISVWQYFVFVITGMARQVVLIGFCLSIQAYVGNKYFGFFLCLVPIVILPIVFNAFEWNVELLEFNNAGTSLSWSDMKGYGGAFAIWYYYRGYWFSILAFLVLLAILVYPRGKEKPIRKRWFLSSGLLTRNFRLMQWGCLVLALVTGFFIHYQNRIVVPYYSPEETQKLTADMELQYSRYKFLPQPRITAVSIEVDLFTNERGFDARGAYWMVNRTQSPIDTLYLEYFGGKKSAYNYPKLEPDAPYSQIKNDLEFGVKILKLNNPLEPGDSLRLTFEMAYRPRGIFDKVSSPIESNGTFINYSYLPTIGYNANGELAENSARKKYGLPPKPGMARVDDSIARRNNILSFNSDWISFEATVSTNEGQITVAPGYLEKDWKKDGRHYFHYKMDSPMMHFYSILSANYQVKKDKWKGVNIEVYYQKGHEYNLARMINGIKKSLDYYTANFGDYQHKQVRILEFPRDRSFAQSFPNTIPFSESMGFINKIEDKPDAIDFPFYVTAHEVAHQWWGHQVAEAMVQGSAMLSESLSQYSALMVMEKEYGTDAMKRFLKYEMDNYLQGRTFEGKGEKALMYCENQQYIHYNKGSVVFYALKDLLGETRINSAIRSYLSKFRFKGPLYANSIALVDEIKAVTPDSLHYAVTDMLEKITIYENYVKALSYRELGSAQYEVTLTVGSAKFYSDSTGRQSKVQVLDLIDIGVFTKQHGKGGGNEKPLVFEKVWMDAPEKTFKFTVSQKPTSAGIDPYLKLVDRTPDNNTAEFGQTPKIPNTEDDQGRKKRRAGK